MKELRRRMDEEFPGRMLLAEANQWPAELRRILWRMAMSFIWRFIFR